MPEVRVTHPMLGLGVVLKKIDAETLLVRFDEEGEHHVKVSALKKVVADVTIATKEVEVKRPAKQAKIAPTPDETAPGRFGCEWPISTGAVALFLTSFTVRKVVAGKLVAFVDVCFNESLIVRGFRVFEGPAGKFLSAPQNVGKDGKYYDSCFLLKQEQKKELEKAILMVV